MAIFLGLPASDISERCVIERSVEPVLWSEGEFCNEEPPGRQSLDFRRSHFCDGVCPGLQPCCTDARRASHAGYRPPGSELRADQPGPRITGYPERYCQHARGELEIRVET